MNRLKIIFFLWVFTIISCAEKLDSTTDESMQESIKAVSNSLDDNQKKEFEEALQTIMLSNLDVSSLMNGEDGANEMISDVRQKLNGLTASDVIKEGNRIQTEIELKKKDQAKIEIAELLETQKKAKKNKEKLKDFEIVKSRFYKRKKGSYYITYEPTIELTVKNGTDQAISRAYFEGTLASPNRSVPWLKDEFNYEISGGLEVDEEKNWKLAPNMFSDWGTVEPPKDAILTVEVLRLDDANGDELYSVKIFGEKEQERLTELLENYPEFSSN